MDKAVKSLSDCVDVNGGGERGRPPPLPRLRSEFRIGGCRRWIFFFPSIGHLHVRHHVRSLAEYLSSF